MDGLLIVSLSALWVVAFVNLALTLRVVRWIVSQKEARLRFLSIGEELRIGAPAPEFRARTLTGRPVTHEDYAGRRVAFIFSSPFCDQFRQEMPELHSLAAQAAENADTGLVIVSDGDLGTTKAWLEAMRTEDDVSVTLPVLVAPATETTFTTDYNPQGAIPFFCLLEPAGTVALQGLLGQDEWTHITRTWAGRSRLASWMARGG
jgi:hypothetical protein